MDAVMVVRVPVENERSISEEREINRAFLAAEQVLKAMLDRVGIRTTLTTYSYE